MNCINSVLVLCSVPDQLYCVGSRCVSDTEIGPFYAAPVAAEMCFYVATSRHCNMAVFCGISER